MSRRPEDRSGVALTYPSSTHRPKTSKSSVRGLKWRTEHIVYFPTNRPVHDDPTRPSIIINNKQVVNS